METGEAVRADLTGLGEGFAAFWAERQLSTLTTVRADGTPHVVPVGVTLDIAEATARVICSGTSYKARTVAAGNGKVAVCQVADAARRHAERYKTPRVNPRRVVIEIAVTKVLGNV